jgi:hypothetical protein
MRAQRPVVYPACPQEAAVTSVSAPGHGAAVLACEDLSRAGWQHRLSDPSSSQAVVAGSVVSVREIRGVLVRRPWIMELELAHIATADREYVAAEMNAFLLAWLSSLPCPVLNRPSGTCLCGPDWRPLQWARAAARAGLDTDAAHCRVPGPSEPGRRAAQKSSAVPIEVSVVGKRCFGAPDERYASGAKRLAILADTPLLTVRFHARKHGPRFLSATAMPDLKHVEVVGAVCDYLLGRESRP